MTIREAILWGTNQIQSPDNTIDAKLLMLDTLKISHTRLLLEWEKKIEPDKLSQYQAKIKLRSQNMPTQYIIGTQDFMGLTFKVNPFVLIPRQDTETLVEEVLKCLPKDTALTGIDIGTGTGCIGLTLAYYVQQLEMTLIDISPEALNVAKENRNTYQLEKRVAILQSDILQAYQGDKVDFIVSNPPYITQAEMTDLMKEVKDYEPHLALTDNGDGLSFYRRIAKQAKDYLKPKGLLAFEIGYNQAKSVQTLLESEDYKEITVYQDLNSLDRVVIASL